jgi:pleckstrin family protein A (phosphoinositide binding specific) protein 8
MFSSAHYKDSQRIDLITRGGRYLYLRANSQNERQKWLVAFGSTKQADMEFSVSRRSDIIKTRMVDLHSSCQILVSHIGSLKTIATTDKPLDHKQLDGLKRQLSGTCDEFLNALAECMDLTYDDEGQWPEHIKPLKGTSLPATPTLSTPEIHGRVGNASPSLQHSSKAIDVSLPLHLRRYNAKMREVKMETVNHQESVESSSRTQKDIKHPQSTTNSDLFVTPTSSPVHSPLPSPLPSPAPTPKCPHKKNLINSLTNKFPDLQLTDNNGIPVVMFLDCSSCVLVVFDCLSASLFTPVKSDMTNNIQKIRIKHETNPAQYKTLQDILLDEVNHQVHNTAGSATDALTWLKRGLRFMQVFFYEVVNGERNLEIAATKGYDQSLRAHHNFLVRGVFSVGIKAVPYYEDMMKFIGWDGTPTDEQTIIDDITSSVLAIKRVLDVIDQFYQHHDLDK